MPVTMGKHERFRVERNAFLKKAGLTMAVVVLSLLRIMTWHDLLTPILVSVTSLMVLWLDEETLTPHVKTVLLTLSIILQILLYQAHIGLGLSLFVGLASLGMVWYRELQRALGSNAKALHLPAFIRRHARSIADHARQRASLGLQVVVGRPRAQRGPSKISHGKAGGRR